VGVITVELLILGKEKKKHALHPTCLAQTSCRKERGRSVVDRTSTQKRKTLGLPTVVLGNLCVLPQCTIFPQKGEEGLSLIAVGKERLYPSRGGERKTVTCPPREKVAYRRSCITLIGGKRKGKKVAKLFFRYKRPPLCEENNVLIWSFKIT